VSEGPKFLILMRHGPAVEPDHWKGPEKLRPLTPEGIKLTDAVCARMAVSFRPTLILTSEYVRARETADRVMSAAQAVGATDGTGKPPQIQIVPELNQDSPWGDWRNAWHDLQSMIDPGEVVVAVGHGPSINEILCWHSGINFNVGLKKAGFAVLQNAHKLVAYVPPQIIT